MKTLSKYLLAGCALALGFAAPFARAEEPAPKKDKAHGPRGERGDRLEAIKERLGLTEAQIATLKPIFKADGEAMKALRDKELSPEEHQAEAKKLREAHVAKVRAVLTPEQQVKFDEMQAKMKERGGKRAGKPGPGPGTGSGPGDDDMK
jgi:Spy/CpxP family protein refolding chaperone